LMQPEVSVVITAYNQAGVIRAAAVSALEQRGVVTEVIIVDDGSSDDPGSAVTGLPLTRVVRQANAGVNSARNAGMSAAQGDFIIFLDGDDALLPDAAAIGLACFEAEPGLDFAVGRAQHLDSRGVVLSRPPQRPFTGNLYRQMLRRPWIYPPSTVMFRTDAVQTLGGFDDTLAQGGEDLELYLRAARTLQGRDHGALVVDYRYDGGVTADPSRMLRQNLEILEAQAAVVAGDSDLERDLAQGKRYVRWLWTVKQAQAEVRESKDVGSVGIRAIGALLWAFARDPGLTTIAMLHRFRAHPIAQAWHLGRVGSSQPRGGP
jgi:hypothetical protein